MWEIISQKFYEIYKYFIKIPFEIFELDCSFFEISLSTGASLQLHHLITFRLESFFECENALLNRFLKESK